MKQHFAEAHLHVKHEANMLDVRTLLVIYSLDINKKLRFTVVKPDDKILNSSFILICLRFLSILIPDFDSLAPCDSSIVGRIIPRGRVFCDMACHPPLRVYLNNGHF